MKKLITFLILSPLCFSSLHLFAFNEIKIDSLSDQDHSFVLQPVEDSENGIKGKVIFTAGVGFNLFPPALQIRYEASDRYNFSSANMNHTSTPMINLMMDYGLGKRFSIGAAFGYQTVKISFNDYPRYTDTWTRIHLALRGDYHIIAKDNIALYTGGKVGYNLYRISSTVPPTAVVGYPENLDVYPSVISAQAHFGFSYFFGGLVGLNSEVGLGWGGPYFFAAGITIKI